MTFHEHNPSQEHLVTSRAEVHGIWYGVCIYKGAKAVMSAIFDMKMELYHVIKLWCLKGDVWTFIWIHTLSCSLMFIFLATPKKRLLKLTWFQGHELRNRRLPEGRVPQVLGATWRWSTSGCFVSPSPGPSFSYQKILKLLDAISVHFLTAKDDHVFLWDGFHSFTFSHFAQSKR